MILILITSPEDKEDRTLCETSNEWLGCWWTEVDYVQTTIDPYLIGYFRIIKKGDNDADVLYAMQEGKLTPLERSGMNNGHDYILAESAETLRKILESHPQHHASNDDCAVVLIKRDKIKISKLHTDIGEIQEIFSKYEKCVAGHDWKDGEIVPFSYSSTGNYWPDMMHLRYGGYSGSIPEEAAKTRQKSFEKVWKALYYPLESFTVLRQKILHLFFPLVIDWCGLADVNGDEKLARYAKEIMSEYNDKGDNAFFRLLEDLKFISAGDSVEGLDNNLTSLSKVDLTARKCIWDYIMISRLEKSSEFKSFLNLIGMERGKEGQLMFKKNSSIQKFFLALDNSNEPKEFVINMKRKINVAGEDLDLNKWFADLNYTLGKLEGKMRDHLK